MGISTNPSFTPLDAAVVESLKAPLTGGVSDSVFALLAQLRPRMLSRPTLFNVTAGAAFAALPSAACEVIRLKNLSDGNVLFRVGTGPATGTLVSMGAQEFAVLANANELQIMRVGSADLIIEMETYTYI